MLRSLLSHGETSLLAGQSGPPFSSSTSWNNQPVRVHRLSVGPARRRCANSRCRKKNDGAGRGAHRKLAASRNEQASAGVSAKRRISSIRLFYTRVGHPRLDKNHAAYGIRQGPVRSSPARTTGEPDSIGSAAACRPAGCVGEQLDSVHRGPWARYTYPALV